MERDSIVDGFEDFLKERADQFRMHPSASVWTDLTAKLHRPRRWPYVLGGVFLFGLGIGAGVMLEKITGTPNASSNTQISTGVPPIAQTPGKNLMLFNDKAVQPSGLREELLVRRYLLSDGHVPGSGHALLKRNESPASRPNRAIGTISLELGSPKITMDESSIRQATLPEMRLKTITIEPSVLKQPASTGSFLKNTALETEKSSITASLLSNLNTLGKRTGLQLYITPSVSYRRLIGQATKSTFNYSGFPYSANYGFPTDVNDAVIHKPAFGLEAGAAFTQPLGKNLRFKAGLQFNYNNYDIEAYSYMPEMAPFSARQQNSGSPINTVAYYRNTNGFSKTWLHNSHLMVSMPLGVEASLFGNRRVRFNVASTIQPTYVLNNKSYLISTNLKNYAQEPSLYRNWNLNAGAEAYLSVDAGTYRWVMGPQVRYQLLSSYKDDYPIREHLVDYGFKIGIQKTLK